MEGSSTNDVSVHVIKEISTVCKDFSVRLGLFLFLRIFKFTQQKIVILRLDILQTKGCV